MRAVSALLSAVIFLSSGPAPLLAQAFTAATPPPAVQSASARKSPPSGLTKGGSRPNRKVPDVTPPSTALKFSETPSDEEIFSARALPEPLVRAGWKTSAAENRALADALQAFAHRAVCDDTSALEQFLRAYPASAWRISMLSNLGILYFSGGYISKSIYAWEDAWAEGKTETDPRIYNLVNRALGELAVMNARVGGATRLAQLLKEAKHRKVTGNPSELFTAAAEGLWQMKHLPEKAFRCGPMAVGMLYALRNPGKTRPKLIEDSKSTAKGTSLVQLRDLAKALGMDLQIAKRAPGAAVIVPAIANWKAGHYSAITKQVGNRYLVHDPIFGKDILPTQAALDAEGSSYFLVPTGNLPTGWSTVADREGAAVWGRGQTGTTDPDACKPCDDQTGGGCQNCSEGMARYSIHLALVSLHIQDTPLFYKPGRGPNIDFSLMYNQRDPNQDSNRAYSNFGDKWAFNWLSYIVDDPTNPGGDVKLYVRGGGAETHSGFNPATRNYDPEIFSQSMLSIAGTGNPIDISRPVYIKTNSDGSKEIYDVSDGLTMQGRKVFLHQIVDSRQNTLTLTYDSQFRIAAITDALGQVTAVSYSGSDNKITEVRDPFGRSASFRYNTDNQLVAIRDMIGITSEFGYGTETSAGLIVSSTTPYGTTTFNCGDVFDSGNRTRWVEATDPLNGKERVEYVDYMSPGSGIIPDVLANGWTDPNIIPQGMNCSLNYLYYRNTFYWDKKAMDEIMAQGLDLSSPAAYHKAHIYHWLHDSRSLNSVASAIEESEKAPLENRVWYSYPEQLQGTCYTGTTNQPTAIGRVLSDGSPQIIRREYNAAGNKTKEIDPVGRTTIWEYDTATGIDLQNVYQVVDGTNQLLASYHNYTSQHLPETVKDAAGQSTVYTYTADGQVETVTRTRNNTAETTTYAYITDPNSPGYRSVHTITRPLNSVTTYTYDSFGRVQTVTGPDGYSLAYAYDNLNRLTTTTYPDGTTEQKIYNKLDVEWTADREGRWTRHVYDKLQHETDVYDPLGGRTQYGRCTCGALESITDPNGHITIFCYDTQSRLTSKTYHGGVGTITYTYDPAVNRLLTVTDGNHQVARYTYYLDNNIQSISYTDQAGAALVPPTPTVSYSYDPYFKRIADMSDGTGITHYEYYPIGATPVLGATKVHTIAGPLANSTVEFTYDEYGRVLSQNIGGVASSVTYDELGRATSETSPLGTGSNAYVGLTNRIDHFIYPNGQVTQYSYFGNEGDNRIQEIKNLDPASQVISKFNYTSSPAGDILTWTQSNSGQTSGNAVKYGFDYDAADQLNGATVTNASTGAQLKQYLYRYDPAGNRFVEQIDQRVTSAAYNGLNQITSLAGGGTLILQGTVSKPSTVTINGTNVNVLKGKFEATVPITPGENQFPIVASDTNGHTTTRWATVNVTGDAARTCQYDLNGNLISDGNRTFTWDARNRLTSIRYGTNPNTSAATSEFTYDGQDRRVKIVERDATGTEAITKNLLWVGTEIAEERDGNNVVTKRYYPIGMQVVGSPSNFSFYYTRDHLRSIRELTDAIGTVQTRQRFDPYGRRTTTRVGNGDNADADFGFTGHYHHAPSDLWLTIYRGYDPDSARWLSCDPIAERGGPNLYLYVANDPVGKLDPFGLAPWYGNYCGPGSKPGPPISCVDAACKDHDDCYTKCGASGISGALSGGPCTTACDRSLCAALKLCAPKCLKERMAKAVINIIFCP